MIVIMDMFNFLWFFILVHLSSSNDESAIMDDTRPVPFEISSVRMRQWQVDVRNYVGTPWRAPCYWDACDQPFSNFNFNPKFNEIDGTIDRRRAKTKCGRTGYSGRGVLPRWGPNHLVRLLFFWKMRGQIFTIWRKGKNRFFEGFADDVNNGYPKLIKKLLSESLFRANVSAAKINEMLSRSQKTLIKLASGTMPHKWNTDNAWVEYHYNVLPCHKNERLCLTFLSDQEANYKCAVEKSLSSLMDVMVSMKEVEKNMIFDNQYSTFCKAIWNRLKRAG
uniref:Uncharacterized protein n=2 Tax=Trichuris muris TaxID=70415 RepID=A0A5S6Q2Q2_TRIMR